MSVSQAYKRKDDRANEVIKKLSSNAHHTKPKTQLRDGVRKPSTKVLSREQMKEVFKYHDSDKDGFLDVKELTKAFGFLGSIIPFQKAHYALGYADANKDGLISEAELDKLVDYATKVVKKK